MRRAIVSIGPSGLAYMAFSALSSFNVGAYLVLLAWCAVEQTGDAKLVAIIFMMSLLLGAVSANVVGVMSDSSNTRRLLLSASGIRSVGAFFLFLALAGEIHIVTALLAFAIVRTLANAIIVTAGAVAFQQTFGLSSRTRRVAEIGIIRQAGIAMGTGLTGFLIESLGIASTALILASVTIAQTPLILLFTTRRSISSGDPTDSNPSNSLRRWKEGFVYLRHHRSVLVALIVLSATFSVAQLTNVLVPVFVQNDLSATADVYGALEMAWAIGGALALFAARLCLPAHPNLNLGLICLGLSGLGMAVFAMERTIWLVVLVYGILGGLFCLTRLISDSQILLEVETEIVGRVRAINLLLTNSIGVIIFALPFVISTSRVTGIYIVWGMALLLLSGIAAYVKVGEPPEHEKQTATATKSS